MSALDARKKTAQHQMHREGLVSSAAFLGNSLRQRSIAQLLRRRNAAADSVMTARRYLFARRTTSVAQGPPEDDSLARTLPSCAASEAAGKRALRRSDSAACAVPAVLG